MLGGGRGIEFVIIFLWQMPFSVAVGLSNKSLLFLSDPSAFNVLNAGMEQTCLSGLGFLKSREVFMIKTAAI